MPRRVGPSLLIAAVLASTAAARSAVAAQPAVAAATTILAPAPLYGADVRSLVFDPRDPDRALAGTSAGHVYRSDDGGESWRDAGEPVPFPGWVVGTLRFDPNREGRLWAGLWGIWGGGSVAFSDDLGATWTERTEGLAAGDQVYALAGVPGAPGRLFAATRTGVWRSDDDGAAWWMASASTPDLIHVSSLLVDTRDPLRMLAGTWRRAFRSDDGGVTWRGAFDGMVLDTEVFALDQESGAGGALWASTCGWVYRGEDFGARWTRETAGFAERRTPALLVMAPNRILAGTVGGLHLSTDGGASFRLISDRRLVVLALAHHPARPQRLLVGTEGAGIWLSKNGGETLAPRLTATANVRVPALATLDQALFAAVAHAGPLSGVYRSPDRGVSFEPRPVELPTVLDLAVSGATIFAATERGLFERALGKWQRVAELGTARVEQVAVAGDRVLARTRDALFTLTGGRFRRLAGPAGAPLVAAFAWNEIWIRNAGGLWRLPAGGAPEAASLPAADGAVVPGISGRLVVTSADGLFVREAPDGPWERRLAGRLRAVPTGDPRFPVLVTRDGALLLLDGADLSLVPLTAPFPAAAAQSAAIVGDRLLVGTSGYGLWGGDLPGTGAARAAKPQPASSESSMRR